MLDKTIEVAKAYLTGNSLPVGELPNLLKEIHKTLTALSTGGTEVPNSRVRAEDTIHDDYLICLEDGRKMKILKRHLQQTYQMTPEEYREKWGLPPDYPMVAKSYAMRRSLIAKEQGLGKKPDQSST